VGAKRTRRKGKKEISGQRKAGLFYSFYLLAQKILPVGAKRTRRKREREKKRFPDSAKPVSFTLFTS